MAWSFNLATAPQDKPIWLATKCGKVTKSEWLKETRFGPARWAGLGKTEIAVAWHEYFKPDYPVMSKLDVAATELCDHLWASPDAGGAA